MNKKRIIFTSITLFFISCVMFSLLNVRSNIYFLFPTFRSEINHMQKEILFENESVKVNEVIFSRNDTSLTYKLLSLVSPSKLIFIEFKKNKNNFSILKNTSSLSVNDIDEEANFMINGAFYSKKGNNIGELIIDGQRYSTKNHNSSGFFKVINGKAWAGPKSLFHTLKGSVHYSCQAHPSVMKNGFIWEYILKESREKSDKRLTYRNLVGMNKEGNICFLISNNGGILSVKEVTLLAKKIGIQTATLLDGGAALQYKLTMEDFDLTFSALNNKIDLFGLLNSISNQITKSNWYVYSPTYIKYQF